MHTLASSFDAMWTLAGWFVSLLIALASLIPSTRGHWSGATLAATAVVFNLMLDPQIAAGAGKSAATPGQWIVFASPIVVGLVSTSVWILRRNRRG